MTRHDIVLIGNVGLVLRAVLPDKDYVSKTNTPKIAPKFLAEHRTTGNTDVASCLQPDDSNRRKRVVRFIHHQTNWLYNVTLLVGVNLKPCTKQTTSPMLHLP